MRWLTSARIGSRPLQMAAQEFKCAHAMYGVRPVEELYLCLIPNTHLVVEAANPGILVSDPLVHAHRIIMASLDHERPGRHKIRQICIVHNIREVEFIHVVFPGQQIAVGCLHICCFPNPLVKIAGADR